jgi:hypothetical protein
MSNMDLAAWDRGVFATPRRTVTISDTIRAAQFRGELEASWRRVLTLAESGKSAIEPHGEELQARSERFRMDRDLITAEETERWLDERGLTLEDFSDFLMRDSEALVETANSEMPEQLDYVLAPQVLRDVLRVDLLFTGEFDRLAARFAWRIAAREADGSVIGEDPVERERARFYERCGMSHTNLASWLGGLECDQAWFNDMLELEAVFRQRSAALLTSRSLERMLQSLRLPLTRFQLELMELDSSDVAREALQCVREDGEPMEEVARSARYPFRRLNVLYEDLPKDLQQKLLCAMPGEVLGPLERAGGFQLCRVLQKTELDAADDEVRRRAAYKIIEGHFSELASRVVHWILRPTSSA